MTPLEALGWNDRFATAFAPHAAAGLLAARVAVEHRARYRVLSERGELGAALAGRLRHAAAERLDLPAVGDWVAMTPPTGDGPGTIEAVLPRGSVFTRRGAGRTRGEQIVAANVDVVFVVTSLNAELNARRLERYLTLAWESGAAPVVVLSKADRADSDPDLVGEAAAVAGGVPVIVTSAKTGLGVGALLEQLRPNRTGALLGSSGVGKSTLINRVLGFERQATAEVREDDQKGRHTTTRRELVVLPEGGVLIDTPGMRELALGEAGHGLLSAFEDIETLAESCAFRDCSHGPEPDCAVKTAVADGRIAAERLAGYHKLVRELRTRASWEDKRLQVQEKQKVKVADRALQQRLKEKRGPK